MVGVKARAGDPMTHTLLRRLSRAELRLAALLGERALAFATRILAALTVGGAP